MKRKDILICGERSFVATGFTDKCMENSLSYDCFSRGQEQREGDRVSGDVLRLSNNQELFEYETVINFIILKERSIEENIQYVENLLEFCQAKNVKHLIQISSISVYPNDTEYINEESAIEQDCHNKGGYASIKVAVDHYLMTHPIRGMTISFVRPGFIYTKNQKISKAGILASKFGMNVLLGDKKTTLPLINRERLHDALIRIVQTDKKEQVYLCLNKDREVGTKYNFVKQQWNVNPICLPAPLFLFTAKLLKKIKVLKPHYYLKVIGLFKRTWFDSAKTEQLLGIDFDKRKFCVLGAGAYGSYAANLLSLVYPHEEIILFDVGNEHLKTEEEIGYLSNITNAPYEGLQKSRFFGFGGATVKWGGQLLTFSENDFANPTPFLKDIVEYNKQYKDLVLKRFNLENKDKEVRLNDKMFTKTGIWLSYFHRNLFKHFDIEKNDRVKIIPNSRVNRCVIEDNNVKGVEVIQNGQKNICQYEYYFLTAGAFESGRILINSGLSPLGNKLPFSDHLSQRAFKVTSGPQMGKENFQFRVKGTSLITKRFVGEVDGYSFYSQPICNENFLFFQDVKKLLFGRTFRLSIIANIIKNIPHCISFGWSMLIRKRLYIYKNEFDLQIDIEAPRTSGCMLLSKEIDRYGEEGLDVDLTIETQTGELFTKARAYVKEYLDMNGVKYEELPFCTTAEKYEDVYHPFGIFSDFEDGEDYFTRYKNMLIINTGVLPRAGGINSTCAMFPMIEEYINNRMV
jgi:nucleoside-diphosphate-sugar epimerase